MLPLAAVKTVLFLAKVYGAENLAGAPERFIGTDYNAPDLCGLKYTLQAAPEDCTGCGLCVAVCTLALARCADRADFKRANYMRVLHSRHGRACD